MRKKLAIWSWQHSRDLVNHENEYTGKTGKYEYTVVGSPMLACFLKESLCGDRFGDKSFAYVADHKNVATKHEGSMYLYANRFYQYTAIPNRSN